MKMSVRIMAFAGALAGASALCFAGTYVTESITGSAGDWTYTYTLTNDEALPIWYWVVWFPSNPSATSVTAGSANWAGTLGTHAYFPQQYISEVPSVDYVYDSTADPFHAGTPNPLTGPLGEPGFYGIHASDYGTTNAGEYWDGDSWEPLPETEPSSGPIFEAFWRGSKYGYDFGWTEGSGGNVQTDYGIANGATGQMIIKSPNLITGPKGYSYNTTDYYYSINDWANSTIYMDFEGSGIIPEPFSVATLFMAIGGLGMYYRKKRRMG